MSKSTQKYFIRVCSGTWIFVLPACCQNCMCLIPTVTSLSVSRGLHFTTKIFSLWPLNKHTQVVVVSSIQTLKYKAASDFRPASVSEPGSGELLSSLPVPDDDRVSVIDSHRHQTLPVSCVRTRRQKHNGRVVNVSQSSQSQPREGGPPAGGAGGVQSDPSCDQNHSLFWWRLCSVSAQLLMNSQGRSNWTQLTH